jgi:hypothetical protein
VPEAARAAGGPAAAAVLEEQAAEGVQELGAPGQAGGLGIGAEEGDDGL